MFHIRFELLHNQRGQFLYAIALLLLCAHPSSSLAEKLEDRAPLALASGESQDNTLKPNQKLIHVKGMVCGMCVQGISIILKKQKAIEDIEIDLEAKSVLVTLKEGQTVSDSILKEAIKQAGYAVKEIHTAKGK